MRWAIVWHRSVGRCILIIQTTGCPPDISRLAWCDGLSEELDGYGYDASCTAITEALPASKHGTAAGSNCYFKSAIHTGPWCNPGKLISWHISHLLVARCVG